MSPIAPSNTAPAQQKPPMGPVSADLPVQAVDWDPLSAYRAFAAHDARFDGRLFIGVRSTGVYCRPVCRVRLPKAENCRYFHLAAAAEQAGFRPCLRCRPELAPGWSRVDARQNLANWAARLLEQWVAEGEVVALDELADRLGVSDRHLRRSFAAYWGLSPKQYLTTQRLLLAKRLLCDSQLPVTEIALACGFGSLRSLHAAFQQHYRLSPGEVRRSVRPRTEPSPADMSQRLVQPTNLDDGAEEPPPGLACLRLAFRPPYDWQAMQQQLASDVCPGVESVGASLSSSPDRASASPSSHWRRSLRLTVRGQTCAGWLALTWQPEAQMAWVQLCAELAPALGVLSWRLRHLLDLDTDLAQVDMALASAGLSRGAGSGMLGCLDGFEACSRILLADPLTPADPTSDQHVAKASQPVGPWNHQAWLAIGLERFGPPIQTPWEDVHRLFPSPREWAAIPASTLEETGLPRVKAQAMLALAQAVSQQRLKLEPTSAIEPSLEQLRQLTGLSPNGLAAVARQVLAWPDAAPEAVFGPRPWRAYAWTRQALNLPESAEVSRSHPKVA